MQKKIIISGGGTGGHIFPALSIANALKQLDPSVDILFVGATGRMEMEKVPLAGYRIEGLPVQGMVRGSLTKNIKVAINLFKSLRRCNVLIKTFNPDIIVGVGGYASGPICIKGVFRHVPIVLQEQNSYAGLTNKFLGRFAKKIFVAYDGMEHFFKNKNIVKTGNPVRKSLLEVDALRDEAYTYYAFDSKRRTVLITGGSLGARTLNKAMECAVEELSKREDVQVIWQCGKYYYEQLKSLYGNKYPNIRLVPFIERMDYAYAISDIVVARAGASTISELSLLGKAAILVPSPNVAEDHQTHNAMALVEKQAALMVKDNELNQLLMVRLTELLNDSKKLESMRENIKKLSGSDADVEIAKAILKIIEKE